MDEPKEYLTQEKFDELSGELEKLKKTTRREIAENLESAKSLGDLSENAEYHEARDMQAATEDRIAKLEAILKSAVIVSEKHRGDVVSIGSTVTLARDGKNDKDVFTLVGSEEVNVKQGKISIHSPIGEALIGKRKGDPFTYEAPSGKQAGKILEVK